MSDHENRSDPEAQAQADAVHPAQPDAKAAAQAARRAALRRLGPLAIVTPPAVLSLLVSERASAESPPIDPPREG